MADIAPHYVSVLKCPDRKGIVAAVTGFLSDEGASITESSHFNDASTDQFFMRTAFRSDAGDMPRLSVLAEKFEAVARRFDMEWQLHDAGIKPRVMILVSKFGHCLQDLLHRWRSGVLPVEIVGVISNHEAMRSFVEWSGLPYHYLPMEPGGKAAQEARIAQLVEEARTDLVVLARYMQILSPDLCARLAGRCINIHHSFLPSFKGAKPYHQAFARGVKMIGATAHYVTTDLDEGPIIDQDARQVSHAMTAEDLVAVGAEIECRVLAHAVKAHIEHRVILNGMRTVVFR